MSVEQYRKIVFLIIAVFSWVSIAYAQHQRERIVNIFREDINDSISVQVKLKYNERGLPKYYFCHVNTPVCEQGLCKAMVLDVYWDVLGNFLKYELPLNESLTKSDHLPFTRNDHEKLKTILADRASILRDYPVEDLVDHRLVRKSEVVDAVSAATRVEVKSAIVSGAVYSTYVLWHIVNGQIASRIDEYTKPLISHALIMEMFHSDNLYYQYYALNQYRSEDSLTYLSELIGLVRKGIDFIPYFAIEKVPPWAWGHDQYQFELIQDFESSDFELQNAFLEKLNHVEVSARVLDRLISAMDSITGRQRIRVLKIGERNISRLSEMAMKTIGRFGDDRDQNVSALARRLSTPK